MKDYFNKQEQLDILALQYADASFNTLLNHPLVRGADRAKLRASKQSLHEALDGIAAHVPDREARKLSRLLKTHRFGIGTPDQFKRETTDMSIDTRDDLLAMCVDRICDGCIMTPKESEHCPVARMQREMMMDPLTDAEKLCEYNPS